VSILTPWNFPHSLNVMKVGNALAAGNTVVLKPSPLTPLAGLALARIIDEHTDIPSGVVNVITPGGIEASKMLTTDPRIDMISFTGSSAVGREVMAAAGGTMKRILLECGGKSAGIFLGDVDVTDGLLQRFLFDGCSLHAGQACILQSRLLLPEVIHDKVVDRLVELARGVKVGDPTDPEVQMGPLISSAQRDRVEAHVASALTDGATLAVGGRRPAGLEKGFYFEPTILTDVTPGARIAQEEVFGPVLSVFRYRDDDDAVAIANNSQYGLSGAVWGTDVDRAVAVARRIRTGQIAVNGCIPGDAPFGGLKRGRTRVHRVVSESEFVTVACGRAEDELGICLRCEIDRPIRCLEGDQLARLGGLGNREPSRGKRDPADRVIGGRLVAPGFAGLEPHRQIVDRGRRLQRARYLAEGAEQDSGGSLRVNVLRLLVGAFAWPELLVGRQGEPELESAGSSGVAGAAAMPCAAGGPEPFDPTGG